MGAVALDLAMEVSAADCQATDLYRLPGREQVIHMRQVLDERIAWMQRQQAWHIRDYWNWQDAIDLAGRDRKAWGALGEAIEVESSRIDNLKTVRRLIGEAAYAAGEMP